MKLNIKKNEYQTCSKCGQKNLDTATVCLVCGAKIKQLLQHKQIVKKLLETKSSGSVLAIAVVLVVFSAGVNIYCVWKSKSCYTNSISTTAPK